MSGISIHAVDVATGRPAAGMRVEIRGPDGAAIADGILAPSGLLDHPVSTARLAAGIYEVLFHVGAYLGPDRTGILDEVPFRFRIDDPGQHYHLPFKFTPFGFSLFRGS